MPSPISRLINQSFHLPTPPLTEKNLPDQTGKVHIITGGYTGVGFELAQILYQRNATVYIAGRSSQKAQAAIERLKSDHTTSRGRVEFLQLDLTDLTTIKPAVEAFQRKESRLDVLTNNAGVMHPPKGSTTAQGYDLQMGTNCLGHFLLTQCLLPVLEKTAALSPPGSVRVTWAGSLEMDMRAPEHGIEWDEARGAPRSDKHAANYGHSKAGDRFLASEFAKRRAASGVLSVCFNPGNLRTELQRHTPAVTQFVIDKLLLCAPVYGAYTELYAGWSSAITAENNGGYVLPWGRIGDNRADIEEAMRSTENGGSGTAARFWAWCEEQTSRYA